jgi:diacylglycerol kinase
MRRLINSFRFACNGIRYAIHTQPNFRIQLVFLALAVLMGLLFKITQLQWTALILTSSLVLILEIINTSIETLMDFITKEYNPEAAKVKDTAAGAVLIASIMSVIIGLIIFIPYIF